MTYQGKPLPSFQNPPVVEVVLGVQFDAIKALGTPQIGLLWQEFREQLPKTEDQPPLEPEIEQFALPASHSLGFHFR